MSVCVRVPFVLVRRRKNLTRCVAACVCTYKLTRVLQMEIQLLDKSTLQSVHSLDNVKEQLVRLSGDSKQLMLMSSSNLVDTTIGDMELISEAREFTAAERWQLPSSARMRVDGPVWTLSAWVRLDRGNILRQVAGETDKTCWSWEVSDDTMQLRLGGHDAAQETVVRGMIHNHRRARPAGGSGGSDSSSGSSGGGSGGGGAGMSGLQHVTVVVTKNDIGGSVRFYLNGVFNASATLPRDVTSCIGPIIVADVLSFFSLFCVHLSPFFRSLCECMSFTYFRCPSHNLLDDTKRMFVLA